MNYFSKYFKTISNCIESVDSNLLENAASMVLSINQAGKKVILVGNGGSAAMASHVSVDLTKASGIRAINFNEADLLTCFANDYGYEYWVEKALEAYADSGDLVIMISSSGTSPNIINGSEKARDMGLKIITLSGFLKDNPLRKIGNINFWVENNEYNVIEMTHHIWLLSIVDYISKSKF